MDDPSQLPQPRLPEPPAPPKAALDHHAYKNRLQELAHKSSIPIPTYSTVNEGLGHLPRFRATVFVDGKSYTSPNTFLHRKEAEQDVARIAYEVLLQKVNNEEIPPVHEDLVFSKSIMNEFATKMHLKKPTYQTCQIQGDIPSFASSLLFNNIAYPTCIGKNKKEAEQLAARAAIQSLLGNAESEATLAPILKAKARLYATLHAKDSIPILNNTQPVVENAVVGGATSIKKDKEALADNTMITFVPPHHEFSVLPTEPGLSTEKVNLPIAFVPAAYEQQFDGAPDPSKKRKKNRKKVHKRARTNRTCLVRGVRCHIHPPSPFVKSLNVVMESVSIITFHQLFSFASSTPSLTANASMSSADGIKVQLPQPPIITPPEFEQ